MGDLKTNWTDPVLKDQPSLGGDTVTQSGGEDVNKEGENGLAGNILWPNPSVGVSEYKETPNSMSGLPVQPTRYEPAETPPEPPSLKDRNPGTIDQK